MQHRAMKICVLVLQAGFLPSFFSHHLVRIVIHHCSSSEKAASKHNYLEADIPVQSVVLPFVCPKSTYPFLLEDCNRRAEHALTSDNRTACYHLL